MVRLDVLFAGREVQKTGNDDKAHKQRQSDLGHRLGKERHADAVERKGHHQDLDNDLLPARPDAGVGLAVIFSHDLVDVGGNVVLLLGFKFLRQISSLLIVWYSGAKVQFRVDVP